MKCEVKLYKAGTVFIEEVIARDYQDARKVALLLQSWCNCGGRKCEVLDFGDYGVKH